MSPLALASAPIDHLVRRSHLLREARNWFQKEGFHEVQTPVLSRDCIIDQHLDPIQCPPPHPTLDKTPSWFLQTSPEQHMKRLLASGMERIYQIGPVFRLGESGKLHNPEFTMLEWYSSPGGHQQGIDELTQLVCHLLRCPAPVQVTYRAAFQQAVGLDPLEASATELACRSIEMGHAHSPNWATERDDWLDLLFSMAVQPTLGHSAPTVVTHFPASQAALAKINEEDRRTAERYELFIDGVELANGYHELLDPAVLRSRQNAANQWRTSHGKSPLPERNWLLDAMEIGLPACSGCALGWDRLVMIACGADSIDQVVAFPIHRA
jgi:lysyl-tRNA synthetase class 2